MAQPTQTRRILIKVDTSDSKGLNDIASRMGLLNKNTKSLAGNMSFLTNVFKGWIGVLGVNQFARMSDEMQNLNSRLKIVTGSTEKAKDAIQQIADLADRTNQSIQSTGETFTRLAGAMRGTGATTEELITLTESLTNTFRVAGTSSAETSNTLIQLSQAFSSGRLSGDELRSVMEQNVVLAGQLRQAFGKDLAAKAKAGLITTSAVLEIIAKNAARVNEEAKLLAPTFEQIMVKAVNKFTTSIGKMNEEFGLSTKFASAMAFAIEHLSDVLIVFGGVAIYKAVLGIQSLIKGFAAFRVAALAFAASNPITLTLTAIATAGVLVYNNWESLVRMGKLLKASLLDIAADMDEAAAKFVFGDIPKARVDSIEQMRKSAAGLRKEVEASRKAEEKAASPTSGDNDANLRSLIAKQKAREGTVEKAKKMKEVLAEINKEFSRTQDIEKYNKALNKFEADKLNKDLKDGKINLYKFNEEMRELEIKRLSRDFSQGKISLSAFNEAVDEEKFKTLNEQMRIGTITLSQYNNEVLKLESKLGASSPLRAGLEGYIKSVGTLGENIAQGITKAFSHLEDNLLDFIKTGTFEFGKFTQAIMDDLLRIIVRASIITPFANAILSGLSAGAGAATAPSSGPFGGNHAAGAGPLAAAKGAAFSGGNVIPFARGGIVDSPTGFSFGGGRKQGVMGEAGTEAILPLARSGNGDLGVQASVTPVTINIINQSGSEVQQTEKTGPSGNRQIDILILAKVREGIASGKYDSAMKQSYGLSRKGT